MPLRKYLFWGLTAVLIVALINLILRGYQLEKKEAQQQVETVEEAKPSSTRVLNPQDLKILQSRMEILSEPGKSKESAAARHEVEIGNTGTVDYTDIQIRFTYFSLRGERLSARTHSVAKSVPNGTTLKLSGISVGDIPASAARAEAAILFADIQSPSPAE
jgi:hypothetical protein